MEARPQSEEQSGLPYISTGHLPTPELVSALVAEAHARYKANTEGEVSQEGLSLCVRACQMQ